MHPNLNQRYSRGQRENLVGWNLSGPRTACGLPIGGEKGGKVFFFEPPVGFKGISLDSTILYNYNDVQSTYNVPLKISK